METLVPSQTHVEGMHSLDLHWNWLLLHVFARFSFDDDDSDDVFRPATTNRMQIISSSIEAVVIS